ncbi:hypothetical protein IG631_24320 [Alternaria alternata]|nr:hypothetical protein IG631_24320 [Alternaria alternata]
MPSEACPQLRPCLRIAAPLCRGSIFWYAVTPYPLTDHSFHYGLREPSQSISSFEVGRSLAESTNA